MDRLPTRYRLFRRLVRIILGVYYRSIETHGLAFIPRKGRTLFIANHQAGLMDGLLIVRTNPLVTRTVIKHTLFENPIIAFFARGLGMIAVRRKQDLTPEEAAKPIEERTRTMFEGVAKALAGGESILLFPEGRSHTESHMLKIRSGAARILLQTEAANDFRLGLRWLPVSLDFEVKNLPGSRVLLHYHPARELREYRDLYHQDPEAAVGRLRDEMETYLHEVTINFATWEDRVLIERLTEIWLARAPRKSFLDRHNALLKWKRIMEKTYTEDRRPWEELSQAVNEFTRSTQLIGVSPHEIFTQASGQRGSSNVAARIAFHLGILAPAIGVGILYWGIPTWIVRTIVRKASPGADTIPSYKIVAGVVLYPAWQCIAFTVLWSWFPSPTLMLGLFALTIVLGMGGLVASRNIRPELRQVMAAYQHRSWKHFLDDSIEKMETICRLSARLWNRGLRRQILIEEVTKDPLAQPPSSTVQSA